MLHANRASGNVQLVYNDVNNCQYLEQQGLVLPQQVKVHAHDIEMSDRVFPALHE